MDAFCSAGWQSAQTGTGDRIVSHFCLSAGGELLSTATTLPYHTERTFVQAELPHVQVRVLDVDKDRKRIALKLVGVD